MTVESRYYLSSLPGNAAEFAEAVRLHWGIENGLHWVLDVVFREDDARVRVGHAAENLALVRRLALQLLKQERRAKVGVKAKRLKAGWDEDYLLSVSKAKMRLPWRSGLGADTPTQGLVELGTLLDATGETSESGGLIWRHFALEDGRTGWIRDIDTLALNLDRQ